MRCSHDSERTLHQGRPPPPHLAGGVLHVCASAGLGGSPDTHRHTGGSGAQMQMMSAMLLIEPIEVLAGDITGEGDVDFADLERLANKWLWTGTPGSILEDIVKDGSVDFLDFTKLAENWMK